MEKVKKDSSFLWGGGFRGVYALLRPDGAGKAMAGKVVNRWRKRGKREKVSPSRSEGAG